MLFGVVILFWILNGGVWCEKFVKKRVGILRDLKSKFSKTLVFVLVISWPRGLQMELF